MVGGKGEAWAAAKRDRGAKRHPGRIGRPHEPRLEGPPQNARKGAATERQTDPRESTDPYICRRGAGKGQLGAGQLGAKQSRRSSEDGGQAVREAKRSLGHPEQRDARQRPRRGRPGRAGSSHKRSGRQPREMQPNGRLGRGRQPKLAQRATIQAGHLNLCRRLLWGFDCGFMAPIARCPRFPFIGQNDEGNLESCVIRERLAPSLCPAVESGRRWKPLLMCLGAVMKWCSSFRSEPRRARPPGGPSQANSMPGLRSRLSPGHNNDFQFKPPLPQPLHRSPLYQPQRALRPRPVSHPPCSAWHYQRRTLWYSSSHRSTESSSLGWNRMPSSRMASANQDAMLQ